MSATADRIGRLSWPELRERLRGAAVLEALGIDPAHPTCPRCRARVEIADDDGWGLSLRCTRDGCRLGALGWQWPEAWGDAAWGTPTRAGAIGRLLATIEGIERRAGETKRAVERFRRVAGIAS
jgi:hypothetical protein